mmetsp:Transcript_5150/g.19282  ORF Transcript_5150/g.19282 Transcript_5150/m.19282 type:complete len:347 (-) Transcript_5150:338-1378(-)
MSATNTAIQLHEVVRRQSESVRVVVPLSRRLAIYRQTNALVVCGHEVQELKAERSSPVGKALLEQAGTVDVQDLTTHLDKQPQHILAKSVSQPTCRALRPRGGLRCTSLRQNTLSMVPSTGTDGAGCQSQCGACLKQPSMEASTSCDWWGLAQSMGKFTIASLHHLQHGHRSPAKVAALPPSLLLLFRARGGRRWQLQRGGSDAEQGRQKDVPPTISEHLLPMRKGIAVAKQRSLQLVQLVAPLRGACGQEPPRRPQQLAHEHGGGASGIAEAAVSRSGPLQRHLQHLPDGVEAVGERHGLVRGARGGPPAREAPRRRQAPLKRHAVRYHIREANIRERRHIRSES